MGAKVSVCPHIVDDVIMHEVVKGGLYELIGIGHTKNLVLLCELHQYLFEFVAMYKIRVLHVKFMKEVRWEGIQLCENFGVTRIFVGRMEDSRVVGWCSMRKVGRPGAWLFYS